MQEFQSGSLQGAIGGISGAGYAKNGPAPKQGVATDLDLHIKRLYGLCERLEEIGNAVIGPVPQNAPVNETGGRPVTSLASRARDIGDLIGRLEDVAARVNNAI